MAQVAANNALDTVPTPYRAVGEADRDNYGAVAPNRREFLPPLNDANSNHPSLMPRDDHHGSGAGRLAARASPLAQKMDKEAIAGTAVGVVLGVALLVFCLYPVVVGRINRRRKRKALYDPEAFNNRGEGSIRLRRLSSSDLKKDANAKGDSRKDHDQDASDAVANGERPYSDEASPDDNLTIDPAPPHEFHHFTALPYYDQNGPFQPGLPHHIVLKGNNEDYYSPYVPSEAFGMFPEPPQPSQPERTVPRPPNSIRYNVKQLLRRKTGREQTPGPKDPGSDEPFLQGDEPMPHYVTSDTFGQPGDIPHGQPIPYTATAPNGMSVIMHAYPTPQGVARIPVWVASSESQAPVGPSIPGQANSTVNPMEIMPASTESEMWHRTDYQMFSYDTPNPAQGSGEPPQPYAIQYIPYPVPYMPYQPQPHGTPQMAPYPPHPNVHLVSAPHFMLGGDFTEGDKGKMPANGMFMPPGLVPMGEPSQRPDYMTDGMHSHPPPPPPTVTTSATEMSSRTSPSTLGDSPVPESGSSDSHSPHFVTGIPSPKSGVYRCDVTGCNQVFDQPHKLKYVNTSSARFSHLLNMLTKRFSDITSAITARITNAPIRLAARVLVPRPIYSGTSMTGTRRRRSSTVRSRVVTILVRAVRRFLERTTGRGT
jgi:hypothetical protein